VRVLALLALAAVPLAGCGGGGSSATQAGAETATVGVAGSGVGDALVDSHNRSVYLFAKDPHGKSACLGACARAWPPLRSTGKPAVGAGANAALLGTTPRSDGPPQVTYNGHPLYLYLGDNAPRAINGQGRTAFGGAWFVVSPSGNRITKRSTSAPSQGY
jgi:predicted lipoprotein with Yx(FWY)xxD motif